MAAGTTSTSSESTGVKRVYEYRCGPYRWTPDDPAFCCNTATATSISDIGQPYTLPGILVAFWHYGILLQIYGTAGACCGYHALVAPNTGICFRPVKPLLAAHHTANGEASPRRPLLGSSNRREPSLALLRPYSSPPAVLVAKHKLDTLNSAGPLLVTMPKVKYFLPALGP